MASAPLCNVNRRTRWFCSSPSSCTSASVSAVEENIDSERFISDECISSTSFGRQLQFFCNPPGCGGDVEFKREGGVAAGRESEAVAAVEQLPGCWLRASGSV